MFTMYVRSTFDLRTGNVANDYTFFTYALKQCLLEFDLHCFNPRGSICIIQRDML
jgi:hypothetical protein